MGAIAIAVAILLPCSLIGFLSPDGAKITVMLAILSTSLWVAVDSSSLNVREYKSQVAAHPFVLFTASLGLWIVVFPVYLFVRSKIKAGLLSKGANPRERRTLHLCIALWCVVGVMISMAYVMLRVAARMQ